MRGGIMKSNYRYKIVISVFVFFTGLITLFQNCSNKNFTAQDEISSSSLSAANSNTPMNCKVGSETVIENDSKIFYLASSVPHGTTCQYENRVCTKGYFTGSFQYTSCAVAAPASCLYDGTTVAHGASVTAYQSSTSIYGGSCVPQQRTCNNGSLSGSYVYSSCTPSGPASCIFNDTTVPHGNNVTGFASSTVPFGRTCQSQSRTCNNGTLSGSYSFGSCTVGAPASCIFNGMTIPHGAGVIAYKYSSKPTILGCNRNKETRICINGTLTGSFGYSNCDN